MTARILDGKALALRVQEEVRAAAAPRTRPPGLAVVLVGADPASQVYVRRKGQVAAALGFEHRQIDLPLSVGQVELLAVIDGLNADPQIDGILVQLPLPCHLDAVQVMDRMDPSKDVDGFTARNSGWLSQGRPGLVPCTPLGVMRLLAESGVSLNGREACVIGRSNIVGRPMAQLLEQANATVTVCHSRTRNVMKMAGSAEILVVAIGHANFVGADGVRDGAVVIDVGMNRTADGKLCGDVDFSAVYPRVQAITPVPGGVGPMTIAMLMQNTLAAADTRDRTHGSSLDVR